MKKFIKNLTAVLCILMTTNAVHAQVPTKSQESNYVLNLDENGCMLRGYDVVAMFTMPDKTLKGDAKYESKFQGAKYWFVSAESKATFDTAPEKYAPLYGGFCAVAVTEGNLRPVQVWTHEITNGFLVVNHNAKAKSLWDNNAGKRLKKANKNWPTVGIKEAKYDILHSNETQASLAATSFEEPKNN